MAKTTLPTITAQQQHEQPTFSMQQ
jgi:hypothetical protein